MTARKKDAADEPKVDPDEVVATEEEQGFRGTEVDPTPNENYTVAGVTSGAPTPETDDAARDEAEAAAKARAADPYADSK